MTEELPEAILETGIDKLARLVDKAGKISLKDASKALRASPSVIEEWAKLLEQEGIIMITYSLTTPYFVKRTLSPKEVEEKVREFNLKKDIFIKKGETALAFLEAESARLDKLKQDFTLLKEELGKELEMVKKDLNRLDQAKAEQNQIKNQVQAKQEALVQEIARLRQALRSENEQLQELSQELLREAQELLEHRQSITSVVELEKDLLKRMQDIQTVMKDFHEKYRAAQSHVSEDKEHVRMLQQRMQQLQNRLDKAQARLQVLLAQAQQKQIIIEKATRAVLEKAENRVQETRERGNETKNVKALLQHVLEKREVIESLLNRLSTDKQDLQKDLQQLIIKAKVLSVANKKSSETVFAEDIAQLEKRFAEVEQKRDAFIQELDELKKTLS